MSPAEFWKLSNAISIAGAAGVVLLTTNIVVAIFTRLKRSMVGLLIAFVATLLAATVFSPSTQGWTLGSYMQFAAITLLLYSNAFGGSRLAAATRGTVANAEAAKFWNLLWSRW